MSELERFSTLLYGFVRFLTIFHVCFFPYGNQTNFEHFIINNFFNIIISWWSHITTEFLTWKSYTIIHAKFTWKSQNFSHVTNHVIIFGRSHYRVFFQDLIFYNPCNCNIETILIQYCCNIFKYYNQSSWSLCIVSSI